MDRVIPPKWQFSRDSRSRGRHALPRREDSILDRKNGGRRGNPKRSEQLRKIDTRWRVTDRIKERASVIDQFDAGNAVSHAGERHVADRSMGSTWASRRRRRVESSQVVATQSGRVSCRGSASSLGHRFFEVHDRPGLESIRRYFRLPFVVTLARAGHPNDNLASPLAICVRVSAWLSSVRAWRLADSRLQLDLGIFQVM